MNPSMQSSQYPSKRLVPHEHPGVQSTHYIPSHACSSVHTNVVSEVLANVVVAQKTIETMKESKAWILICKDFLLNFRINSNSAKINYKIEFFTRIKRKTIDLHFESAQIRLNCVKGNV